MNTLRDKEPFIANGVIGCLRKWKERCAPAPMIVTDEDIDQLVEWAAELHDAWENAKAVYVSNGIPYKIIPEQINR